MKKNSVGWLKANGYDGLYYPGECGCLLGELKPCGEDGSDCFPGYRHDDPRPVEKYQCDWAVWKTKRKPTVEEWEDMLDN